MGDPRSSGSSVARAAELGTGIDAAGRVDYAVPGGKLVNRLLVSRDLQRIFAYRGDRLRERFGLAPD